MKLSASLEDYLEAIFHVGIENKAVRSRDIAKRLNVNRSSVTGALRSLAEKGLIDYEPYEVITLTKEGESAARGVVQRHKALHDFLVKVLSVDEPSADEVACKMEHNLPQAVLQRLVEFVDFVENCPRAGATWMKGFVYHCTQARQEECEQCIAACLEDVRDKKMTLADSSQSASASVKNATEHNDGIVN